MWIKIEDKLPSRPNDGFCVDVIMIDKEAGIRPFIGFYDHSEKGGGFYLERPFLRRVICTHYMELPEWRDAAIDK